MFTIGVYYIAILKFSTIVAMKYFADVLKIISIMGRKFDTERHDFFLNTI